MKLVMHIKYRIKLHIKKYCALFKVGQRNKKKLYLPLFTSLGLLAALSMQGIWLYNTYGLTNKNIYKESSEVIAKAVRKEASIRFKKTPEGTTINGSSKNDTVPEITYFYQGITEWGFPIDLQTVDSIATALLEARNIKERFTVCTFKLRTGEILQKSKDLSFARDTICSEAVPILIDLSEGVKMVIVHPYRTFLQYTGLTIMASILMLVLIIGCIAYQIKVIIYQRRVAKLREDFSYAMVHDMKTPLSTITLCANFLSGEKAEAMPDLKEEFGKAIRSESTHLLRLTNKLLTLSKLESHTLVMQKEKVQLRPMVEKIVETFRLKSDRPVRFVLDLRAEELTADREHLEESVYNLVDNAVKYAKDDGEIEITVTSETDEANGYIRVRDNGIGISRQDRKKIFDKFERGSALSSSRFGKVAGFGLGLSYVYRVAEAHGGTVLVHSVVGEFSEFTILIPQVMEEYNENETENYGA